MPHFSILLYKVAMEQHWFTCSV